MIIINNLEELPKAVGVFLKENKGKHFAFSGEMGVGKTTFIKELCKQLGSSDNVSSPTFSIVNIYQTDKKEQIFHFDFYRINEPEEAMDIGIEEYFDTDAYIFIEWAENIGELLPEKFKKITIVEKEEGERLLTINN